MTVRRDYSELPTYEWTAEEAEHHLRGTFDMACKAWPDLMEPYVVRLDGADDPVAHMRSALRETAGKRYASRVSRETIPIGEPKNNRETMDAVC